MNPLLITFVLLLFGCNQPKDFHFPPQKVQVRSLKKSPVIKDLKIPCQVFDRSVITLSFPVSGIVSFLAVEGQVQKDRLLAQLKVDDLMSNLEFLDKELAVNESILQRYSKLKDIGGISNIEFEKQKNRVVGIKSQIASLKQLISDRSVVAGSDGFLGPWRVKIGETVKPYQEIGFLRTLDKIFIDCKLPSEYLSTLAENRFSAQIGEKVLKVTSIDPSVDSGTDLFTIRFESPVELPNGLIVDVSLKIFFENLDGFIVPLEAIKTDLTGNKVFTIFEENGAFIAKTVIVDIQKLLGDKVLITAPVEEGSLIVVSGIPKLFEGAPVEFELHDIQ